MTTWVQKGTVLVGTGKPITKLPQKVKLLIYDLDHTLIQPTDGKRFSQSATDWKFFKNAKKLLQEQAKVPGNVILLVSNQAGLVNEDRVNIFKEKVNSIFEQLNIPTIIYAALEKDIYRKPNDGIMRDHIVPMLLKHKVSTIMAITYVGDAAGRLGDFSDSDRKWLTNVKLYLQSNLSPSALGFTGKAYFKTPEVAFCNSRPKPFKMSGFEPGKALTDARMVNGKKVDISQLNTSVEYLKPDYDDQEVILTIGEPGCGKSQIADQVVDEWGYEVLSQDNDGSRRQVIKKMVAALERGKSVLIDNTFPDAPSRAEYISAAQKYFNDNDKPIRIRAFHINGDWTPAKRRDFAMHMNTVRMRMGGKFIPAVAYNVYRKKQMKPHETEGFTEIINTKFLPRFTGPAHVLAYCQLS